MKSGTIVDLLGWSGILLWLGLSTYFAWSADGAKFQAVGVVGISAAITYFVMQRHAAPYPEGALELDLWRDKRISQAADAALRAHAHISILAKAIENDARNEGRQVSSAIAELAAVPIEHSESVISRDPEYDHEHLHEAADGQKSANEAVNLARRRSEILQAVVVVLGTLQSGLGSLLFSGPTTGV